MVYYNPQNIEKNPLKAALLKMRESLQIARVRTSQSSNWNARNQVLNPQLNGVSWFP